MIKIKSNINIPVHVAIIPDGNRRWAREKGFPTLEGHRKGFERVFNICKKSREMGIKIITFWAFSTDNWKRSKEEVNYLMKMYSNMIEKYLKEANKNKIRIIHLGRKDRLNKELREKIIKAEKQTKTFDKYYLAIALDYGGKDEIIRAVRKINIDGLKINDLDEGSFEKFLDTKDLPQSSPDLIIRTSGEKRHSGFLMWQGAYSEYIFSSKYLPDFTEQDFEKCILEFNNRQRRFGG